MNDRTLIQERDILNLIEEKKLPELKGYISQLNPVDLAEIVDELDEANSLLVLRLLPKELGVEVFSYFDVDKQKEMVSLITDAELKYILDELYFDDMIDLLEEMPAEFVSDVLKNAPHSERRLINEFLNYPKAVSYTHLIFFGKTFSLLDNLARILLPKISKVASAAKGLPESPRIGTSPYL